MQKLFMPNSTGSTDEAPRYRSGAVARMVRIPVSTLRIWERRYKVVAPPQSLTGHRLYSGADVERLLLIKQLVDLGHAIGSVAVLDTAALLQIAEARAALDAPAATGAAQQRPQAVILGLGLARRLGSRRLQRLGTWADLAAAELQVARGTLQADLLVAELATLQPDTARRITALMQALGVQRSVVVYGFGTDAAADLLRAAGCQTRRTPLPDSELNSLVDEAIAAINGPHDAVAPPVPAVTPPRLFDDEALVQLAAASGTVACECPRHLAEIVRQLSDFETYSAECTRRGAADAGLHRDLERVAGTARAMFEQALLRVAQAEGLALPPPLVSAAPAG
jgi:DNA-binding transcriptional MerR regulator